jgi:hypothetical protein
MYGPPRECKRRLVEGWGTLDIVVARSDQPRLQSHLKAGRPRHIMIKLVLKFAFLVFPAVLILLHWRRHGVRSRVLYTLSWVETGGYVVWLLLIAALASLAAHPTFDWIRGSSVPANMLVVWPFFAILMALGLCVCTVGAEKGERGFVATSNLLMLILWATSIAAPN